MSKGFSGVKPFQPKCYLKLKLTPKDWCTYEGTCRVDQLMLQNGTCHCCQYKKMIDVPTVLERMHNERCEAVQK